MQISWQLAGALVDAARGVFGSRQVQALPTLQP